MLSCHGQLGEQTKGTVQGGPFIAITRAPRWNGGYCAEELIKVKILLDDDKYFQVRASMEGKDRAELLLFLIQNVDVFA